MNTDEIREQIIDKPLGNSSNWAWWDSKFGEAFNEIDRLEKENEVLCQPFCGECGEAIGGSTFNNKHRYEILVGCGCREQRTKEACKEAMKDFLNPYIGLFVRPQLIKKVEQAISEV